MTKTLDTILSEEKVLIDTNILLCGFDSYKNELPRLDKLPQLTQYISRILEFAQNSNSQISVGVYSEYRLIFNENIRPRINDLFFIPNLPIQTRQELSKLKSEYREIKKAFMSKKINSLKLENENKLYQSINSFENYSRQQKPISQVDIELFITACEHQLPIITNDSDFRRISNWFEKQFENQFKLPTIYTPIDFEDETINREYKKLQL